MGQGIQSVARYGQKKKRLFMTCVRPLSPWWEVKDYNEPDSHNGEEKMEYNVN